MPTYFTLISQIYAHNSICTHIQMPGSNTDLFQYALVWCTHILWLSMLQNVTGWYFLKFAWNSGCITQDYTEQMLLKNEIL